MPRNKLSDPYDPDCAVKGCPNIAGRTYFCRKHYGELATFNDGKEIAIAIMGYAHELGRKRKKELRRRAKERGYKLLSPEAQMLTAPGRAAHEARDRAAAS